MDSLFTIDSNISSRTITFVSKGHFSIPTESTILTKLGGFAIRVTGTKVNFTLLSEEAGITVALEIRVGFPCNLQADAMPCTVVAARLAEIRFQFS